MKITQIIRLQNIIAHIFAIAIMYANHTNYKITRYNCTYLCYYNYLALNFIHGRLYEQKNSLVMCNH